MHSPNRTRTNAHVSKEELSFLPRPVTSFAIVVGSVQPSSARAIVWRMVKRRPFALDCAKITAAVEQTAEVSGMVRTVTIDCTTRAARWTASLLSWLAGSLSGLDSKAL
jgi:hypothetical protein